ncbi:MAG: nucleotide kinase domain-containing protein [Acidobacteriaceae bacterium]
MRGQLFIFEGPDGTGKTTLSHRFVEWLTSQGQRARYVSSPGRVEGSLGELVYRVHHNPERFGLHGLVPTAQQLLHVAAHIDALHSLIIPALESGETIVMDRFWWSTVAYGKVAGVDRESLQYMIALETHHWSHFRPRAIFLLNRPLPARTENSPAVHNLLGEAYAELEASEEGNYCIHRISTSCTVEESFDEILSTINGGGTAASHVYPRTPRQANLPLNCASPTLPRPAPAVFTKLSPAIPSEVYETYWRFAAKRQEVFFKRVHHALPPWTDDNILLHFKFTNAYRASDRVSQYLIRNVIYAGDQRPEELFFRILLFKLFNKIETWQLLETALGPLTTKCFDLNRFDQVLTSAMARKRSIYSGAYIMPSGGRHGDAKKHRNHLALLQTMLSDGVPRKITRMKEMREVFESLLSYPMIGEFLAYQYATDLNYSTLTSFSEKEFVVPGPGARDGIRKCFKALGGLSEVDIIRMVADRQQAEFERLGIEFKSLWGRPLQLIDCQNLFCEVDKYARHAHPEVVGITGRTRIKQVFRSTPTDIDYWFPPKWGLNELIERETEAPRVLF